MYRGEGVGRGMPVPTTITEQTQTLRSTNKSYGKLTGIINGVIIGSIKKDDLYKLLCLSVLFNVTKPT